MQSIVCQLGLTELDVGHARRASVPWAREDQICFESMEHVQFTIGFTFFSLRAGQTTLLSKLAAGR